MRAHDGIKQEHEERCNDQTGYRRQNNAIRIVGKLVVNPVKQVLQTTVIGCIVDLVIEKAMQQVLGERPAQKTADQIHERLPCCSLKDIQVSQAQSYGDGAIQHRDDP